MKILLVFKGFGSGIVDDFETSCLGFKQSQGKGGHGNEDTKCQKLCCRNGYSINKISPLVEWRLTKLIQLIACLYFILHPLYIDRKEIPESLSLQYDKITSKYQNKDNYRTFWTYYILRRKGISLFTRLSITIFPLLLYGKPMVMKQVEDCKKLELG